MKIHIRIGLVVVALLGLLTACVGGGDTAPRNNAKIDQETCIDEVGRDICAAAKEEQITVRIPFKTSSAEVTNADGEVVGNLTEGDTVRVVCFRWIEGSWFEESWPEYGILMDDVTVSKPDSSGEVDYPDRFATGTVDGVNLDRVGFVPVKFFDRGDVERDELRPQLEQRFDNLEEDSCEDNRVVVDHAGQSVVAGQPTE